MYILLILSSIAAISFGEFVFYQSYTNCSSTIDVMGRAVSKGQVAIGLYSNLIYFFSVNSTQLKYVLVQLNISKIKYSSDNSFVITSNIQTTVWDLTTKNVKARLQRAEFKALSWDDQLIAVVQTSDFTLVRIRDSQTLNVVYGVLTGHQDFISSVEFSRDGRLIATASYDNTVVIWNATTFKLIKRISFAYEMNSASFSPDGQYLVTQSSSSQGQLSIWRLSDFSRIYSIKCSGYSARFNNKGTQVIQNRDFEFRFYDLQLNQLYSLKTAMLNTIQISEDDQFLLLQQYDQTQKKYHIEVWKENDQSY